MQTEPGIAFATRTHETPGLEINLLFRKVHDDFITATANRQKPFTYGHLPSDNFFFVAR